MAPHYGRVGGPPRPPTAQGACVAWPRLSRMPAVHWSARLTAAASRIWASTGRLTLCGLAVGTMGFGVMWRFGILSHIGLLMVLVSSGLALLALRGGRWRQGRG